MSTRFSRKCEAARAVGAEDTYMAAPVADVPRRGSASRLPSDRTTEGAPPMEPVRENSAKARQDDLRVVQGFAASVAIGLMLWLTALIIALR